MAADLVVIGLGHVGLPLSRAAVSAGLATVGYDVSGTVVSGLAAGSSHVGGVLDAEVAVMLDAGFHATTDPAVLDGAQTVVICVPTGLTPEGLPDLSAVEDAARAVAARLRPGMLIVLESTSCPGTTEDVVRPLLEHGSGLQAGEDFHLAYSPQRIDPGNETWTIRNAPKVVSGCSALCAKYAVAFYSRFVDHLVVARGTREAEMAKLLENTYRYVNMALVDEVALFCHETGIDIWDVLHCAASKPCGFAPFRPGTRRRRALRSRRPPLSRRAGRIPGLQPSIRRQPHTRSSAVCRTMSWTECLPCSPRSGAALRAHAPCCSESPTKRMWPMSGRRQRTRWRQDCSPPVPRCPTTTPT